MREADILLEFELYEVDSIMETYLRESDIEDSEKSLLSQAWDMIKTADNKYDLWKKTKAATDHTAKTAGDVYDKAKSLSDSIVSVIPMPNLLKSILSSVLLFLAINSILGPVGGVTAMGLGKMASTYKKETPPEELEKSITLDKKIREENNGNILPIESERTKEYIETNKSEWEQEIEDGIEQAAQIDYMGDKLRKDPGYDTYNPTKKKLKIDDKKFKEKVKDLDAMFKGQKVAEEILYENEVQELENKIKEEQNDPSSLQKFIKGLKTIKEWSEPKYRALLDWAHSRLESKFPIIKKMPRKWRERWAGLLFKIVLATVVLEVVNSLSSGDELSAEETIDNTINNQSDTNIPSVDVDVNEFWDLMNNWSWDDPDTYNIMKVDSITDGSSVTLLPNGGVNLKGIDLNQISNDLSQLNPTYLTADAPSESKSLIQDAIRSMIHDVAKGSDPDKVLSSFADEVRLTKGQTHSLYKALIQTKQMQELGGNFSK